jgi:hypothetical protein
VLERSIKLDYGNLFNCFGAMSSLRPAHLRRNIGRVNLKPATPQIPSETIAKLDAIMGSHEQA